MSRTCSVSTCETKACVRGLCHSHYFKDRDKRLKAEGKCHCGRLRDEPSYARCLVCREKYKERYRQRDELRKKKNEYKRQKRYSERKEALDQYEGKCSSCGETGSRFLTIAHIDDSGESQRTPPRPVPAAWLKKNSYPDGFQVLCRNCRRRICRICDISDCGRKAWARGLCQSHYLRHRERRLQAEGRCYCGRVREDASYARCLLCREKYKERYRQRDEWRKKRNESARQKRHSERKEALDHYGGRCGSCGEIRPEFLTIDHIDGGGKRHRKTVGPAIVPWLRKNGYPEGFQVLCMNCNIVSGKRVSTESETDTRAGKRRTQARGSYAMLRDEAFHHYGSKCACCGGERREFLTIDHAYGGGTSHVKAIGYTLVRWLSKNGYPDRFRILCMNCNHSIGVRGYCPHDTDRNEAGIGGN